MNWKSLGFLLCFPFGKAGAKCRKVIPKPIGIAIVKENAETELGKNVASVDKVFAQHMLRASHWNYGLVASLGHWSLEALRRYYGLPPKEELWKFGLATLPRI